MTKLTATIVEIKNVTPQANSLAKNVKTATTELENVTPHVDSPAKIDWDSGVIIPLAGVFLSASVALVKEVLAHRAEIKAKEAERIRWLEEQNDLLAKTLIGQKQGGN